MSVTILGRKIGNVVIVHGTWTHTKGAVEETIEVAGLVLGAVISHNDTGVAHDILNAWSVSRNTTTGISTITVHNQADVTDGRFIIFTTG